MNFTRRIGVAIVAALLASSAFADVKISNLPVGSTITGVEAVPVVQGGVTVQTTPAALNAYVNANLTGNTSGSAASATTATTATQLAGTPSQCTNPQFAQGIAANGNANCATPASGASPGGATNSVQYNNSSSTTLSGVSLTADQVLQGSASTPQALSIVNCGSSTQALSYSTSTHTFGCQSISASAGPGTSLAAYLATDEVCSSCASGVDPTLSFTSVPAGGYSIRCMLTVASGAGSFVGAISSSGAGTAGAWFLLPFNGGSNSPSSSLVLGSGSTIPIAGSQTGEEMIGQIVTTGSGTIGITRSGTVTFKAGSGCVLTTL